MYVIFPADELIYMTYGAAIPRFKPRPTLDNLREPLVPFDTLPNHKTSQNPSNRQSYPQNSNASNEQKLQKQRQQQQQQQKQQKPSNPKPEPKLKPESKPKPEQKPSKKKEKTDIFGYTSLDSREPSIYPDDVYVSGVIAQSSKRSTATTTATTFSLPSPSASSSSSVKQPPPPPPPSPARIQQAITTSNGKPPGKSKSRLHLGLGIFGSKQQTTPEPARLRTYHEFRVSNPTFTRENISARNYDAFFESGEPVYRLEHRTPVIPHVESDPFDSETAKRPHSFGLFSKMSKSKETTAAVAASAKWNARSRSSDPMSMVSEKGDRQRHKNKS